MLICLWLIVAGACSNSSMQDSSSSDSDDFISSSTELSIDLDSLDGSGMRMEVGRYVSIVDMSISIPVNTQVTVRIPEHEGHSMRNTTRDNLVVDIEVPFATEANSMEVMLDVESLDNSPINSYVIELVRLIDGERFVNVSSVFHGGQALDADENRVAVGKPAHNTVALFVREDGGEYTLEQEFNPLGEDADLFGFSVAIDGDFIAIGASLESSREYGVFDPSMDDINDLANNNALENAGAVFVWKRMNVTDDEAETEAEEEDLYEDEEYSGDDGGSASDPWQLIYFVKSDISGKHQYFGHDVSIVDHGRGLFTLAVAHPGYKTRNSNGSVNREAFRVGAVSIYSNVNTEGNALELVQTLRANAIGINQDDFFGYDIDMNERHIIIGAKFEASNRHNIINNEALASGAAFVFSRDSKDDQFGNITFLKAPRIHSGDRFGSSVAVDGDVVFVGAPQDASDLKGVHALQDETRGAEKSGAVHIFRMQSMGDWRYEAFVKAPNADASDHFGASVDADVGVLVVGSPYEDGGVESVFGRYNNNLRNSGAAYVFGRNLETLQWEVLDYLKEEEPLAERSWGQAPIKVVNEQIYVKTGGYMNF